MWRAIVEGAATLAERLDGTLVPADAPNITTLDKIVARRLSRWTTLVAQGDDERFDRRLRFDGISPDVARRAIGPMRLADPRRLPAWARLLSRSFDADHSSDRAATDRSVSANSPIRYEDELLPMVRAARCVVATRAMMSLHRLAPNAHAHLERVLLQRLSALATPTLDLEWGEHRERGLASLFTEYPSLARLLSTHALHWADATAELLERLNADANQLATTFNGGAPLGEVIDARSGLSDPHRGGRTVCILHFLSGMTVVYKPRSLAPERAFADVVEWLGARMAEPVLTALRTIDRGEYGWIEYASPSECSDDNAVRRYFERAGLLLGTMYALCGGDMHEENIMACGEYPTAIDLEVLALPQQQPEGLGGTSEPTPWTHVTDSVLTTSMLPVLRARFDGSAVSSGGLTIHPDRERPAANVPTLCGIAVRREHSSEVRAGFCRMYRAIVAHRDELLAPSGPLATLAAARARVVMRPTRVYQSVLDRCTAPRYLRDGVDRSIELEVLRRPFTRYEKRHRLWPVLSAELEALERLDVPVFEADATGTALFTSKGVVKSYVAQSGFERVRARVSAMGDADLERQTHFIRLAYAAHEHRRERDACSGDDDLLLRGAVDVARLLERVIVPMGRGVSWQGLCVAPAPTALTDVGPSLGSGRAGIALFFAAMARATNEEPYRRLAIAALNPLAESGASACSLGIAKGDAGIAYALATAAELIDEPSLLIAADRVAARITHARINASKRIDVWDGVAGTLLGLLAVYDATGQESVLASAAACGRRLLAARPPACRGARVWFTPNDTRATGFAHGPPGVEHALFSLFKRCGTSGFRDAAMESQELAAETIAASSRDGGWSTGGVGVGLSRVANLDVCDTARARREIETALASALRGETNDAAKSLDKADHLYGGNLGRAELLEVAGVRLERGDLRERARTTACAVAARAQKRGTFGGGVFESAFSPGLFDGLAGIGYELLRLRDSRSIPSLLLFE